MYFVYKSFRHRFVIPSSRFVYNTLLLWIFSLYLPCSSVDSSCYKRYLISCLSHTLPQNLMLMANRLFGKYQQHILCHILCHILWIILAINFCCTNLLSLCFRSRFSSKPLGKYFFTDNIEDTRATPIDLFYCLLYWREVVLTHNIQCYS